MDASRNLNPTRQSAERRHDFWSSTSRTFWASAVGVNGFCRKSYSASRTPCRTTASSVYPDMNTTFQVRLHRRQPFGQLPAAQVRHDHVGYLRFQHLLPAERQELPDQRPGALPGLVDLDEYFPRRIVGRQIAQEQVAVPSDDGEQVVEVVRHAAGERAGRRQSGHHRPPAVGGTVSAGAEDGGGGTI
jgi:hypothetical protein